MKIEDIVINNLTAKAGDLNEPGKINKFIHMYEVLMDRLTQQADMLSKNANCGGCGKRKDPQDEIIEENPAQGHFDMKDSYEVHER